MPSFFARFTPKFASSVGGDADEGDAAAADDHVDEPQYSVLFKASGGLFRRTKVDNEYAEVVPEATIEIAHDVSVVKPVLIYMIVREKGTGDELMRVDFADLGVLEFHYPTVMWPVVVNRKVQRFAFNFVVPDVEGGVTAERVAEKFVSVYRNGKIAASYQKPPVVTEDLDDDVAYVASAFTAEVDDGAAEPDPVPPPPAGAGRASLHRADSATRGAPNAWMNDVARYGRILTTKADGTLEFTPYTESGLGGPVVVEAKPKNLPITRACDVVVAQRDTKAALLGTDQGASGVSVVDVETGATDEYMPGLEYQMAHLSLYGGRTDGGNPDLLVCSNAHSCFAIDTRLDPKRCAVLESGKTLTDYTHAKRKDQTFTCHATSAQGFVATGDAIGQIRLFSGPPGSVKATGKGHFPKIAKTLLTTAANEPICHIDITADGEYVLATTKQFLLVANTKMPDSEKLGFTERMGAAKPKPTRLDVPPEVVADIGDRFALTRATFGVDQETGEHVITSSVGPYVLVWELAAVKSAIPARAKVSCVTQQMSTAPRLVAATDGHIAFIDDGGVGVAQLPRRGKTCVRF